MAAIDIVTFNGKRIFNLTQSGRMIIPEKIRFTTMHKTLEAGQIDNITTDYTTWPQNTAIVVGETYYKAATPVLVVCTTAGTTNNSAEPTWDETIGDTTADGTVTWTTITENACAAKVYIYAIPHHDEKKADTGLVLLNAQRLNLPSLAREECTTVIDLDKGVSGYEALQIQIDYEGIDASIYLEHIIEKELYFKLGKAVVQNAENTE